MGDITHLQYGPSWWEPLGNFYFLFLAVMVSSRRWENGKAGTRQTIKVLENHTGIARDPSVPCSDFRTSRWCCGNTSDGFWHWLQEIYALALRKRQPSGSYKKGISCNFCCIYISAISVGTGIKNALNTLKFATSGIQYWVYSGGKPEVVTCDFFCIAWAVIQPPTISLVFCLKSTISNHSSDNRKKVYSAPITET